MNLRQGYRPLSIDVVKLVSAPWMVTHRSNKELIKEASAWLKEFNQSTNRRYAIIVYRRHAYLFYFALKNRILLIQDVIPATYGALSYILETYLNVFRKILFRKFLNTK